MAANCPTCGHIVDKSAIACTNCGRRDFQVRDEWVPESTSVCPTCNGSKIGISVGENIQTYDCRRCDATGKITVPGYYKFRDIRD